MALKDKLKAKEAQNAAPKTAAAAEKPKRERKKDENGNVIPAAPRSTPVEMLSKAREKRAALIKDHEDALKAIDEKIAGYAKQAEADLAVAKSLLTGGKTREEAEAELEAEFEAIQKRRAALKKLDDTKLAAAKVALDAEAVADAPAEKPEDMSDEEWEASAQPADEA